MARPVHRLAANAPGSFFVDASRIGYGTCWRWDPTHVAPGGGQARVARQPAEAGGDVLDRFCPGAVAGGPGGHPGALPERPRLRTEGIHPPHGGRRQFIGLVSLTPPTTRSTAIFNSRDTSPTPPSTRAAP